MNTRNLAMYLLVAALTACGKPQQEAASTQVLQRASAPAPLHSDATVACPSQNFETFFDAFSADAQLQKAFVNDPMEIESVDVNAEPEPKLVTRQLKKSELSFPLLPSPQQQIQEGLKRTVTRASNEEMVVKLSKDDTDYQLIFVFRHEGCWTLYRKQDDSL